ncbi:MAG TPA: hypothetical protein VFC67_03580 [Prolixibacteraceae bacterium]|nr:hypothetical protein [Prolixibacteraceae bacterium]
MKALKLVALGIVLVFASSAQAQISVHLNIGSPPAWGPSGYSDVQYYYLPDVEAYYDVNSSMFIYYEGRSWVHRSYLPSRYRNYDLYGGYKVVMNGYHGKTPYYNHREYKTKYAKGYRGPSQRNIGERPGRGSNSKDYRQSNQVNRGRGTVVDRNDKRGDKSYNRHGTENKNSKSGNNKNDRGRGNDKRK